MKDNGYIDLQVNGYRGVDFSSPQLTEQLCANACRDLLADKRIAGFVPTVITSSKQTYERNLAIIADIIESPEFRHGVLGIHAEGPFISPEQGAVGAHDPALTQKPDRRFFDQMQKWAKGHIKILTIAAEVAGAGELCEYAVSNAVAVSLGHQLAGADELKRLANHGATLLTHVGNAMPNTVHKHNNSLIAALAVRELTAMIITDGHHLPPFVIRAIVNAKGSDRMIITSDASPIAAMPPGKYEVLGNSATLEENGLLHNIQKQCLVGSSATISQCVDYLKLQNILTPEQIIQTARENPLKVLNQTD
jgi:N-acetylglucosamine-6-phosphate deacetylase